MFIIPHSCLLHYQAANVAIGIAVFAFYVLDFALNALQASLRNLLLDITPPDQLNAGNAWHSRMGQAGNIVGYGFGMLLSMFVYRYCTDAMSRFHPSCEAALPELPGWRSVPKVLCCQHDSPCCHCVDHLLLS